ncbi:MAG: hypothetical protein JWO56_205 [Acidobacteria bacterium]|nr:hypothetical protein [Acidobacteriota bacterium]
MKRSVFVLVLSFTLLAAAQLFAGEGMWMPQQVPQLAAELRTMGLQIDPNRLADLTGDPMGAVISLGGCTASFVSPDGLFVTNHHCGFGAIQYNSTPQRDLITNGFLAKTREEELPAGPGQHVWVTTKIEDVTDRVTGKMPAKATDVERVKTIDRREKELTAECEKPGGVRCKVSSFFEGSQFLRITQLDLDDVRLVYAPANSIGDFGGEIDNFEWPRHTGDFSFLRAYQNGQPFHPKHWLKVSKEGVNDGDFVLVAGYPGRTFRYKTADETRNYRDFIYPTSIRYYTELIRILEEQGRGSRDVQIRNASRIRSASNSLKNYQSVNEGFVKDRIVESRLAREELLQKGNASLVADLAAVNAPARATQERDTLLSWIIGTSGANATYRSSPMLTQAIMTLRAASERTKKDADRAAGFQDRDRNTLREKSDRAQKVIEPGSDRAALRFFLGESQKLPPSQRIRPVDDAIQAAGGLEPFLDKLYGSTKVGDAAERTKMYGQTSAQLNARNDSMLAFAGTLLPLAESIETRDVAAEGAMARLRPGYFEALRKISGGNLYPDANSTLRITFGKVQGYSVKDATWLLPQTTVKGLLQKNSGKDPFDAPKALLDAGIDPARTKPYEDPQLHAVPVDFLSTCDTTGGNSGSPTLNAKGELCGLLFDGNYESIDADFLFTPEITRSIHVDTVYMLWVMDAVDRAHNVMRELGVTPVFDGAR